MRGFYWVGVLCFALAAGALPAHAASCTRLLDRHFSDSDLLDVSRLSEIRPLRALVEQRLVNENRLARLHDRVLRLNQAVVDSRGGLKRWELLAHRYRLPVNVRVRRFETKSARAAALRERYLGLIKHGAHLEQRVQLALKTGLDNYGDLTGDDHLIDLEAAISDYQDHLRALEHVQPVFLSAVSAVDDLARGLFSPAPDGGDADRTLLAVLPTRLAISAALIEPILNRSLELDLDATRQFGRKTFLQDFFAPNIDEWRHRLGENQPNRDEILILRARLRNTQWLLQQIQTESESKLTALSVRLTEILIRLEDIFLEDQGLR